MTPSALVAAVLLAAAAAAAAQDWSPRRNVEIVVPNPPGGSNDKTARTVERIWASNRIIPSTVTVVNRPGGGSIAYTYVQQRSGDPHYLVVAGPALLTNHIVGASRLHHS
jgi:putative tricarboxylic transport membrane protein